MEKIDLTGLKDEDIKLIKEFVEFLKARAEKEERREVEAEEFEFHSWPLGVKGKITREEIYDYL